MNSRTNLIPATCLASALASFFMSSAVISATCSEKDEAYARHRNETFMLVDKACSKSESVASKSHNKYRTAVKSGMLPKLKISEWKVLVDWHNTCFISLAELAAGKRHQDMSLVTALSESLRLIVKKINGRTHSVCSGFVIGSGIATAGHCFLGPDGQRINELNSAEYFVYVPDINEQQELVFSVESLRGWGIYAVYGRSRYRPLTATDFLVLSSYEGDEIEVELGDSAGEYSCGESMILAGNMVSHEKALRALSQGNSKVSDSIKIGGIDSICVSPEDSRTRAISHFCSSVGGQSGSPIYQQNNSRYGVVGIHLGAEARGDAVLFNKMIITEIYQGRRLRLLDRL